MSLPGVLGREDFNPGFLASQLKGTYLSCVPGVEVLHVVDCSMGFGPEAATFGAPHHTSSGHL